MSLPSAYIDNVNLFSSNTRVIKGNRIKDCTGATSVKGITIKNCQNVILKDNIVVRMRSPGVSKGFEIENCLNLIGVYNVASRMDVGMELLSISTLNLYNLTLHNTDISLRTDSSCTIRNASFTADIDWKLFNNNIGVFASAGATVDLDYVKYSGIGTLTLGSVLEGSNIEETQVLYLDEENDDLTPDYISNLIGNATPNPLGDGKLDFGGIASKVEDEITADKKYFYNLLDNSFWDVENPKSGEVSFVKAYQSRIFANSEVVLDEVRKDYYLKTMNSNLGFSELFPAYTRYQNASKFNKKIADLFYATQQPATLVSYNTSIGGYNLFPSFFKRIEDVDWGWIIGQSAVNVDNYLLGLMGQRYGIVVDALGLSTLSQSASGEMYNNVMECVADIAPVKWLLHDEPQPTNYWLFTDLYNDYEGCVLENMIYNNDFAVSIDQVDTDGEITTPFISTITVGASGNTEISLHDRIWSEDITRTLYYRQGDSIASMSSWTEIENTIGGYFPLTPNYLQFKIEVSGVKRRVDYEFVGLCLRPYSSARDFTQSQPPAPPTPEDSWISLPAGSASKDHESPPTDSEFGLVFPDDGVDHSCGWGVPLPPAFVNEDSQVLRFVFASPGLALNGTAVVNYTVGLLREPIPGSVAPPVAIKTVSKSVQIVAGETSYVDVDISDVVSDTKDVIGTTQMVMYLSMERNPSDAGDNLAGGLMFIHGHSVEE